MRIIDSNRDYYDYLQNIWRDDTVIFDRRDSYELSREEFASAFFDESYKWSIYYRKRHGGDDRHKFVLLQVCHTFWFFELLITKTGDKGICLEYELHLIEVWQDYTGASALLRLSAIRPPRYVYWYRHVYSASDYANLAKRGEFEEYKVFDAFVHSKSKGAGYEQELRHIPILKNIGIAAEIPPEDLFLALEEYFLTEKRKAERTESVGLTDKEKAVNHGFDARNSFRNR